MSLTVNLEIFAAVLYLLCLWLDLQHEKKSVVNIFFEGNYTIMYNFDKIAN